MNFDDTLFNYTIDIQPTGAFIDLIRLGDNAKTQFFIAGVQHAAKLQEHMDSLTTDQCKHFFPDGKVKNTGKK